MIAINDDFFLTGPFSMTDLWQKMALRSAAAAAAAAAAAQTHLVRGLLH
jgi:hypothetical protein